MFCLARPRIKIIQPGTMQTKSASCNPERAIGRFYNGGDVIACKTVWIRRLMLIPCECSSGGIEAVQTGPVDSVCSSTNPKLTV